MTADLLPEIGKGIAIGLLVGILAQPVYVWVWRALVNLWDLLAFLWWLGRVFLGFETFGRIPW